MVDMNQDLVNAGQAVNQAALGAWEQVKGPLLKYSLILNGIFIVIAIIFVVIFMGDLKKSAAYEIENAKIKIQIKSNEDTIHGLSIKETQLLNLVTAASKNASRADQAFSNVSDAYSTNTNWLDIASLYQRAYTHSN